MGRVCATSGGVAAALCSAVGAKRIYCKACTCHSHRVSRNKSEQQAPPVNESRSAVRPTLQEQILYFSDATVWSDRGDSRMRGHTQSTLIKSGHPRHPRSQCCLMGSRHCGPKSSTGVSHEGACASTRQAGSPHVLSGPTLKSWGAGLPARPHHSETGNIRVFQEGG